MDGIFLQIVNMSVAATVTGGVVLALRAAFKRRLPRWSFYLLWLLVLVRLVAPFSLPSQVSAFNIIPTARTVIGENERPSIAFICGRQAPQVDFPTLHTVPDSAGGGDAGQEAVPGDRAGAAQTDPSTQPGETVVAVSKVSLVTILATIWVCGAALLVLYSVLCYAYTLYKLRCAECLPHTPEIDRVFETVGVPPGRVRLYLSDLFASPVVCGLLRPRLVFPGRIAGADLPHVVAHELTHIRRHDNLWKLAATVALYLHWFNPFIWLFYNWYVTDMEASCDEAVVVRYHADPRAYAYSLVNMAAKSRSAFSGGALAFGECALKERVRSIMNAKKNTVVISILCIAVILGLSIVFLTNPQGVQAAEGQVSIPQAADPVSALEALEALSLEQAASIEAHQGRRDNSTISRSFPKEDWHRVGMALDALRLSATEERPSADPTEGLEVSFLTGEVLRIQLAGEWMRVSGSTPAGELPKEGQWLRVDPNSLPDLRACFASLFAEDSLHETPAVSAPETPQGMDTALPQQPAQGSAGTGGGEIARDLPELRETNPPCLRVPYDAVVEMNLIDRESYVSCPVLEENDRLDILALLNAMEPEEGLNLPPADKGIRLLQVRMSDGTKYDYWCHQNLLMCGDEQLVSAESGELDALYGRLSELETTLRGQGRVGAEWLLYMNPYRITDMEVQTGEAEPVVYRATASETERDVILDVSGKLKGLTVDEDSAVAVQNGSPFVAPEGTPRYTVRLVFEGGVEGYTVCLFDGGVIQVGVDSISYITAYRTSGDGSLEALAAALEGCMDEG